MRGSLGSNTNGFFQTSLLSVYLFIYLINLKYSVIISVLEIIKKMWKGAFKPDELRVVSSDIARGILPYEGCLVGIVPQGMWVGTSQEEALRTEDMQHNL